jgi:hypothetical protein
MTTFARHIRPDAFDATKPGFMSRMSMTKWRRSAVAVSVVAVMLLASACSGSDEPSSDSGPVETASDPTTGSAVDGAALLQTAVDELADSPYHFLTVVTAGGGVALQAEGDQIGDGSRFVVLRDDASVEYVVTADGTWVKPDGEEWRRSDIEATTANPVPALAAATTVTVESTDDSPAGSTTAGSTAGSTVVLVASVPDAALGYEGDRAIEVTVTLLDGAIDQVQYFTTVQGLEASLLTRVGPVTDDAPVVAPI